MLTVNTNGMTDRSSWYEFFKALVAVDMLCVRSKPSLNGIAVGIGQFPRPLSFSLPSLLPVSACSFYSVLYLSFGLQRESIYMFTRKKKKTRIGIQDARREYKRKNGNGKTQRLDETLIFRLL